MKKIISKVSGIFIPVTNMQRSVEWYKQIFGLETIDESDYCSGLAFPGEATFINLWKVDRPQPTMFDATGGDRIPYYNFESFDIEHSYKTLQDKGVEVLPIIDHGGIRFFDCLDPDGNRIGIVEEKPESTFYPHKQKYRKD